MIIQNVFEDKIKALNKELQNALEENAKALDKNNTEILNAMHFGSEEELLKFKTGLLSINVRKINDIDTLITTVYALYEKRRKKLVEKSTSTPPQQYDENGKTKEEWEKWYENRNNASKRLSQFRSKFWIDFNDLLDHYYDDKYHNIDEQELSNWKSETVKRMLNYFQEDNRDRYMYHFSIKNMKNFIKATYLINLLNNNNNFKKKQEDRFDDNITDAVFINNKSNVMYNGLKTNMLKALTQFNNTQLKPSLYNFNNANPSYNYNISNNAQNNNNAQKIDDYFTAQQIAEMKNNNNGNHNNSNFNFYQANIGIPQNNSNNAQKIDDYFTAQQIAEMKNNNQSNQPAQINNVNGNINHQSSQIPQIFTNNSNFNFYQANIDMSHQPLNNNSKRLVNTGILPVIKRILIIKSIVYNIAYTFDLIYFIALSNISSYPLPLLSLTSISGLMPTPFIFLSFGV